MGFEWLGGTILLVALIVAMVYMHTSDNRREIDNYDQLRYLAERCVNPDLYEYDAHDEAISYTRDEALLELEAWLRRH